MADPALGRFVWHEVMTPDSNAAAAFYQKVVGWTPQPWDKDPSYTLLSMGGRPMAGSMTLPDEAKAMPMPSRWISYISTPDVDATAKHAKQLGGQINKQPRDIPEYGRFAILSDPQGAVFAAFTPNRAATGDTATAIGDFSWHELYSTDWESAWTFYSTLFAWEKSDAMDMGPGGIYQMFGPEGKMFGGMSNKGPQMTTPPLWLPYALVTDVHAAAATIAHLGGKVIVGPMEVPGGDWIVQGIDPQGVMFGLHSKKRGA
jgi:predicted enzyme related to lactoylglutathione lyase